MTRDEAINPNLAIAMARQFGITIMHGEAEQIVQMLKTMHRQGFENGVAIEREACAKVCEELDSASYPYVVVFPDKCAAAIRARGNT